MVNIDSKTLKTGISVKISKPQNFMVTIFFLSKSKNLAILNQLHIATFSLIISVNQAYFPYYNLFYVLPGLIGYSKCLICRFKEFFLSTSGLQSTLLNFCCVDFNIISLLFCLLILMTNYNFNSCVIYKIVVVY